MCYITKVVYNMLYNTSQPSRCMDSDSSWGPACSAASLQCGLTLNDERDMLMWKSSKETRICSCEHLWNIYERFFLQWPAGGPGGSY